MNTPGWDIIDDDEALRHALSGTPALAVYFSGPDCRVCSDLKPRIARLLAEQFPRIARLEVDCGASPGIAARHQVFSVPVLVVFFEGREQLRVGRSVSLKQLEADLARPYGLFFE